MRIAIVYPCVSPAGTPVDNQGRIYLFPNDFSIHPAFDSIRTVYSLHVKEGSLSAGTVLARSIVSSKASKRCLSVCRLL